SHLVRAIADTIHTLATRPQFCPNGRRGCSKGRGGGATAKSVVGRRKRLVANRASVLPLPARITHRLFFHRCCDNSVRGGLLCPKASLTGPTAPRHGVSRGPFGGFGLVYCRLPPVRDAWPCRVPHAPMKLSPRILLHKVKNCRFTAFMNCAQRRPVGT